MEKDEEMSFLARFQVYGLFKQQLEMRLVLKETLLEKPEILEVIVFLYGLLCKTKSASKQISQFLKGMIICYPEIGNTKLKCAL